mmetsp:Transcript_9255/g.14234  ORF Transcript_9255/g.14234 Transcript_9255/m.14234 type:complete len:286 (-) Transcript_9255:1974-2831(-)
MIRYGIKRPFQTSQLYFMQQRHESQKSSQFLVELSNHVTTLTLNRPKAANAMGSELMEQFSSALTILESCEKTRCVILTSSSKKIFSAGADLKERATMSMDEAELCVSSLRSTFQRLSDLPMPTISAVEGVAVGGGLELAAATDIIVSSKTATFGLPETSLGIIPGAGGTQRVPRLAGTSRGLELMLTARRFSGKEAFDYGIVQFLTEDGLAYTKALELAQKICQNAPIAVRAAKEAVKRGMLESTLQHALEIERECYARTLPTKDRLEGLVAFREGRKPRYKGH